MYVCSTERVALDFSRFERKTEGDAVKEVVYVCRLIGTCYYFH